MLPAPLGLSLAVAEVAVAQAVAQAATPDRCYCCFLPGSYFEHPMLMAREAASLRPQGDVSCAKTPSRPVPRRIEQNAPGLAPLACALQCSSPILPPCENDSVLKIHCLFTTCSCVGTSKAIICVAKLFEVGSAQRRSSHLSNFRCQWRWRNCRVWMQNKRSVPNSTAIVHQCIWC